mmetsp:Transcript_35491/g.89116  ORF Transcript_35491/g.89116 Transcript_35491/m.89116 type:complete len:360 (+) Transcript_35491:215-1294(+)
MTHCRAPPRPCVPPPRPPNVSCCSHLPPLLEICCPAASPHAHGHAARSLPSSWPMVYCAHEQADARRSQCGDASGAPCVVSQRARANRACAASTLLSISHTSTMHAMCIPLRAAQRPREVRCAPRLCPLRPLPIAVPPSTTLSPSRQNAQAFDREPHGMPCRCQRADAREPRTAAVRRLASLRRRGSDLLENGLGARVARHRLGERELLQQGDVVRDDLELAGDAVVEAVALAELLLLRRELEQLLRERRVAVARHRREEVVLELPLHAAPHDVRDRVVALGVARRAELRLDEVILAQRVAEENLLRLVRDRHDGSRDQPRQPDRVEEQVRRHQRSEEAPVRGEPRGLVPLLVFDHVPD